MWILVLSTAAAIAGFIATGAFSLHHRSVGIWTTYVAVILALGAVAKGIDEAMGSTSTIASENAEKQLHSDASKTFSNDPDLGSIVAFHTRLNSFGKRFALRDEFVTRTRGERIKWQGEVAERKIHEHSAFVLLRPFNDIRPGMTAMFWFDEPTLDLKRKLGALDEGDQISISGRFSTKADATLDADGIDLISTSQGSPTSAPSQSPLSKNEVEPQAVIETSAINPIYDSVGTLEERNAKLNSLRERFGPYQDYLRKTKGCRVIWTGIVHDIGGSLPDHPIVNLVSKTVSTGYVTSAVFTNPSDVVRARLYDLGPGAEVQITGTVSENNSVDATDILVINPAKSALPSPQKSSTRKPGPRSLGGQDKAVIRAAIETYRKDFFAYVQEHDPNDKEAFNFASQLLECLQNNTIPSSRFANYPGNSLEPAIVGIQFQRNPSGRAGFPLWVQPLRAALESLGFETHDGVNHLCDPGNVFIEVGRRSLSETTCAKCGYKAATSDFREKASDLASQARKEAGEKGESAPDWFPVWSCPKCGESEFLAA